MRLDVGAETNLFRLLLVERNAGDRRLFEEYCKDLSVSVRLHVEASLQEGFQACKTKTFDVLFLNIFSEQSHSLEHVQNFRTLLPDVPLIVLFGLDNEALALQALRFGADDCLSKATLDGSVLQRTILFTTERKNTFFYQEKYLRLEHLLASFLESAWVTSPQGETLYMSLGAETIYGYPVKRFLVDANFWCEVVHPDDRPFVQNYFNILRERGRYALHYRIIRADGSVRLLYDRARAVYNQQGDLLRFEGLVRDTTDDLEPSSQVDALYGTTASETLKKM
jgi:PAS domain S-box-containing protein